MNTILTKINSSKPAFKDLIGLKKVKVNDNTIRLANSLHPKSNLITSDDELILNVCTEKGFYEFYNYSNKYILRIGSPSGKQTKKWYKVS